MEELREQLEYAIDNFGISDIRTLNISEKLNAEICKEQKGYKKLKSVRKSIKELLQERIRKLESYVGDENCSDEVLKKIYSSHIEHLNDEIRKIDIAVRG